MITGKATSVEPNALLVNVKSTTDSKAYSKGPVRVPSATLHYFQMQTKGKAFRIAGTALGLFGGAVAAGLTTLAIWARRRVTTWALASPEY